MAKCKYGIPSDWAKHLRPYGRKKFWKKIRRKVKDELRKGEDS